MDFALNENQSFVKDGAERFILDKYTFEDRRKRLAQASGTDRGVWSEFAEMGWLGLLVPEEQQGLGWDMEDAVVLLRTFGAALVAEPLLDGAVVSVSMLSASESPRATALLADVATGEALVVPALLEKNKRYLYGYPTTKAERQGNGFRLSGQKILVQGGDAADALIVSATLDNELSLFVVPAVAEGVSRSPYRLLDGTWAADVEFDRVSVEPEALLGGREDLERALDCGSIGVAAQQAGSLFAMLSLTADYLHTRNQFGQPLANFQALQHAMADLYIDAEIASSAIFAGLAALRGTAAERKLAVSAARVRMNRAGLSGANTCVHLHGGMGMTMEYPVGHHYRRMVQLARTYGDTEFHLQRYEDEFLGGH